MYKDLLEKQFMLDFNCSSEELDLTFFKTSQATKNSRHFSRGKANIVNYNNKLYVRTENKELTDKIKKLFKEVPAEWFFEVKHIENLSKVLKEYDLKIQNFAPFFVPKSSILQQDIININKYQFFYGQDIAQFKNDSRIKMSFGYSEEDPDTLGLGYYDKNELIAICGASQSGKYTWDIGIEILDESYSERGLATNLIRHLTSEIQKIAPETIPVYATALSHTKSMNVAINAGYYIGWTEILIN